MKRQSMDKYQIEQQIKARYKEKAKKELGEKSFDEGFVNVNGIRPYNRPISYPGAGEKINWSPFK